MKVPMVSLEFESQCDSIVVLYIFILGVQYKYMHCDTPEWYITK